MKNYAYNYFWPTLYLSLKIFKIAVARQCEAGLTYRGGSYIQSKKIHSLVNYAVNQNIG